MNSSVESELLRLEKRIGSKLPADYRAFLLAGDSGSLAGRTVAIEGLAGGSDLQELLGFGEERDLFWYLDLDVPQGSIGWFQLPCGFDATGIVALALSDTAPDDESGRTLH